MIDGKYTTCEAAGRVGISLPTLQRWIAAGKVKAPKPILIGAVGYRLWSAYDIDRLKAVKQAVYRKRSGVKRKKV
jgi:excisionase family DNA binding protein